MKWLIKDMSNELKVWVHPSETAGNIIPKSDGEPALRAVRDALAKYHGGIVVQEGPAVGESQSNGLVEEAGIMVREFVRVLKEQIEGKKNVKLKSDDVIIQWMIRRTAMMVFQGHGRQRWRNELRGEKGQSMQSSTCHVRGRKSGSARMRSSQSGM